MIIGYKKIKHCEPGQLVRFEDGQYAVVSEYGSNERPHRDTILLGSGEYFNWSNPDEWVAIIDTEHVEVEAAFEADYPNQATKE